MDSLLQKYNYNGLKGKKKFSVLKMCNIMQGKAERVSTKWKKFLY